MLIILNFLTSHETHWIILCLTLYSGLYLRVGEMIGSLSLSFLYFIFNLIVPPTIGILSKLHFRGAKIILIKTRMYKLTFQILLTCYM